MLRRAIASDDLDLRFAAVDTMCRRFAGYVPPGGSEMQYDCAQEWLGTQAPSRTAPPPRE